MRSRFWEFWTDPDIAPEIKRGRNQLKAILVVGVVFVLVSGWALFQFFLPERKASVLVDSVPQGAAVLVNGVAVGVTPYEFSSNNPGAYVFRVMKAGFRAIPDSVTIELRLKVKALATFQLTPSGERIDTTALNKPASGVTSALPSVFKRGVQQSNTVPDRRLGEQEYLSHRPDEQRLIETKYATIQIESDPSGAEVWIDNTPTSKLTPYVATLPLGIHRIVVKKSEYRAVDGEQIVSLSIENALQKIHFPLVLENQAAQGTAFISTRPIDGKVYLDGALRGNGEVTITPLAYGEYTISFGAIEGYRTPSPKRISLTSGSPSVTIVGAYEPLLSAMIAIDDRGGVKSNNASVVYGVFVDGNFVTDDVNGPQKKYFKEVNFWAWEIGYGYQNRNPSGSDALEIRITIPEGADKNALKLRLFGYATNRAYPFTVGGKTRITVEVNGRTVADGITPSRNLDREDPPGYDEWRIGNWLQPGENRIILRASSSSTAMYLLSRIVIL